MLLFISVTHDTLPVHGIGLDRKGLWFDYIRTWIGFDQGWSALRGSYEVQVWYEVRGGVEWSGGNGNGMAF